MNYSFTQASTGSLIAFLLIVSFVVSSLLFSLRYSSHGRSVKFVTFIWLLLSSLVVGSGWIERSIIPGVPIFFLGVFISAVVLGFSKVGKDISQNAPLWALVAFQGFRLPLELVLHSWAEQGTIPYSMTWSGQNIDIVAGVLAIIAAPFVRKTRIAAWIFQVVGSLLLLNVIRVAVMSGPFPFAWGVEPPLLLALYLPYAWIGTVCVAGALVGHIILMRALLAKRYPG